MQQIAQHYEKRYIIFFLVFFLPFTSSMTLGTGTILNTTSSNSSINFTSDINLTNFTIESTFISLYGINFTNSTGIYTCDDLNHSTANNVINNSNFTCTWQALPVEESTTPSGSSGGSATSNYISILMNNETIQIFASIRTNQNVSIFLDNKKIGIDLLEIKTKNPIRGNLEINELTEVPDECDIMKIKNFKIYKILKLNNTFDENEIKEVSLDIFLDKNKASKISAYKCFPEQGNLDMKIIDKETSKYRISSKSFSIWIIGGIEDGVFVDEKEKPKIVSYYEKAEEIFHLDKIPFGLIGLLVLIILLIFVLIKYQKRRTRKQRILERQRKRLEKLGGYKIVKIRK